MFSRIREDIRCVFERDPAARSVFEVLTCYPGFHALQMHRFNHCLWALGLRWLAAWARTRALLHRDRDPPGAMIGRRVFIDHGMGGVIGENRGDRRRTARSITA